MVDLCKSYALNISSLIGLYFLVMRGQEMMNIAIQRWGGALDCVGFVLIPISFGICLFTLLALLWEYFFKIFKFKYAYNFPYKNFPMKPLYYFLFYLGLIAIMFPIFLLAIFLI